MITKLRARNFQSHRDSTVELAPGFNAVVGSNDAGKTALFWRAFRWVALNRPAGEAFRSHWGGTTRVDVWLDNGVKISRVRSKKRNEYMLRVLGVGKPVPVAVFKALGRDVPPEITRTLNMGEVNWQGAFSPHYLLTASPGDVARQLNDVAGLGKIDESLSKVSKVVREANASLQGAKTLHATAKAELSSPRFTTLPQRRQDVDAAWALLEKRRALMEKMSHLMGLAGRGAVARQEVKRGDWIEPANSALTQGFNAFVLNRVQRKRTKALRTLLQGATRRHREAGRVFPSPSEVEGLVEASRTLSEMQNIRNHLFSCIIQGNKLKVEVDRWSGTVDLLVLRLPKSCPTCGANMKE